MVQSESRQVTNKQLNFSPDCIEMAQCAICKNFSGGIFYLSSVTKWNANDRIFFFLQFKSFQHRSRLVVIHSVLLTYNIYTGRGFFSSYQRHDFNRFILFFSWAGKKCYLIIIILPIRRLIESAFRKNCQVCWINFRFSIHNDWSIEGIRLALYFIL